VKLGSENPPKMLGQHPTSYKNFLSLVAFLAQYSVAFFPGLVVPGLVVPGLVIPGLVVPALVAIPFVLIHTMKLSICIFSNFAHC
jgi:hypothetical protein